MALKVETLIFLSQYFATFCAVCCTGLTLVVVQKPFVPYTLHALDWITTRQVITTAFKFHSDGKKAIYCEVTLVSAESLIVAPNVKSVSLGQSLMNLRA